MKGDPLDILGGCDELKKFKTKQIFFMMVDWAEEHRMETPGGLFQKNSPTRTLIWADRIKH